MKEAVCEDRSPMKRDKDRVRPSMRVEEMCRNIHPPSRDGEYLKMREVTM